MGFLDNLENTLKNAERGSEREDEKASAASRAEELAAWVRSTGSEYVGVCLDLVNNVSLIETPQQTIDTLAPYTIFVSFKDIGVDFYSDGILLSEVAFGEGHLNLAEIVARFQKKDPKMLLTGTTVGSKTRSIVLNPSGSGGGTFGVMCE